MLTRLRAKSAAHAALDPAHPVKLRIDLVVGVPDRHPGHGGTYSHHVGRYAERGSSQLDD
jgi:hypothetical protein